MLDFRDGILRQVRQRCELCGAMLHQDQGEGEKCSRNFKTSDARRLDISDKLATRQERVYERKRLCMHRVEDKKSNVERQILRETSSLVLLRTDTGETWYTSINWSIDNVIRGDLC